MLTEDSVGQEGAGSQMRFEDQMSKKSFIADAKSQNRHNGTNAMNISQRLTPAKSMAMY